MSLCRLTLSVCFPTPRLDLLPLLHPPADSQSAVRVRSAWRQPHPGSLQAGRRCTTTGGSPSVHEAWTQTTTHRWRFVSSYCKQWSEYKVFCRPVPLINWLVARFIQLFGKNAASQEWIETHINLLFCANFLEILLQYVIRLDGNLVYVFFIFLSLSILITRWYRQ